MRLQPPLGAVLEGLAWAGLLVGFWVTTLTGVTAPEMLVATGCALLCAPAVVASRRVAGGRWRPDRRLARWLAWLPLALVADGGRILRLGLRQGWRRLRSGQRRYGAGRPHLEVIEVPAPGPGSARAAWTEAASILVISAAPGSYALDASDAGDVKRLVVHVPAPGWPRLEDRVAGR